MSVDHVTSALTSVKLSPSPSTPPPCAVYTRLIKSTSPDGHKVVNDYKILSPLGEGAYATVHLAEHLPTHQLVAVKKMSKSKLSRVREYSLPAAPAAGGAAGPRGLLARPRMFTALDKVRKEVEVMKRLSSPHVVSLLAIIDDESEDGLHLVLEYCEKGQVMHWDGDSMRYQSRVFPTTQHGSITEPLIRPILHDVLAAVSFLHAHGVLHRDIKPDNLLVAADLKVKLADFGVAREFREGESSLISETQGTYHFYAPEMCSGDKFDAWGADVWAIGVTLFIFATGRLPWMSRDNAPAELFDNIGHAQSARSATASSLLRHSPSAPLTVAAACAVLYCAV